MGKLKKPKKAKASKSRISGGGIARAASSLGAVLGTTTSRGGGGRRRRTKSPTYWANKVLVAKLKKKYYKIQYGGRL